MEATLAAISRMYPDARFFTLGGRRVEAPVLYPWRRGWKCQINGEWNMYDQEGHFVSAGESNYHQGGSSVRS